MSQNMFTAQWTQTQSFYAYMDNNGNIVSQTMQGNQVVGVSVARYKQLEQLAEEATNKAENYKKQLVDAGLIQEPLSEQEQIAQLTEQVANLTTLIQQMGAKHELQQHPINGTDTPSNQQSLERENNASTTNGKSVPSYKGRSVPINAKA